jgi:hypothetical protein
MSRFLKGPALPGVTIVAHDFVVLDDSFPGS